MLRASGSGWYARGIGLRRSLGCPRYLSTRRGGSLGRSLPGTPGDGSILRSFFGSELSGVSVSALKLCDPSTFGSFREYVSGPCFVAPMLHEIARICRIPFSRRRLVEKGLVVVGCCQQWEVGC